MCKVRSKVTHIKQQKYFHHLKGRGYNKNSVLYPGSGVVLETRVLVSRRLEDRNGGLGLETWSLGLGLGLNC